MEFNNHLYNSIKTTRVFLIGRNKGRNKRKTEKLIRVLKKESLQCDVINWNKIKIMNEGLYVLCTPPRKDDEKKVLKRLIADNLYIISFFECSNGNNIYDHLLCLPPVINIDIIKSIILLVLSNRNQELRLQKFREEMHNRNKEWVYELALANELQKSLLPRNISKDLPINFAHRYLPHAYIGGDFYDIIRLTDNRVGIIIADVSGHGTAAAFITAMLKSALDHLAPEEESPARLLSRLNQEFNDHIREHYITAFYSIIDIEQMVCTYCNAGHPAQLLIHTNGTIDELKTSGFFIGMFKDIIFEDRVITLLPGDRLVFYTDGVIGVKNKSDERFGLNRLKSHLKEGINENITLLSNNIINNVILHMKENRFPDDLTLLIAEMIEDI